MLQTFILTLHQLMNLMSKVLKKYCFNFPTNNSEAKRQAIDDNKRAKMGETYFHELKNKPYFFIKTNIKMARLILTHVTPTRLLREEATSGNPWPPDSPTITEITSATFEFHDFFRIFLL
ncbi:unnamed protein product [Citrullus colocynthis]|uniref:ENTH domain-containing protein n=1 Tax=Citrullus colocynthis TaxID=252529 RepID=A0ABP0YTA8_9ROSI